MTAAEKLMDKQLHDAARLQLEHQHAADYHQAMADMYRKTETRLNACIQRGNP